MDICNKVSISYETVSLKIQPKVKENLQKVS